MQVRVISYYTIVRQMSQSKNYPSEVLILPITIILSQEQSDKGQTKEIILSDFL